VIDNFALAVSHGLILLAAWLLTRRDDLDREPSPRDKPTPRSRAVAAGSEDPPRA
jgi:hypothetical protein